MIAPSRTLCLILLLLLAGTACAPASDVEGPEADREAAPRPVPTPEEAVPAWAADAVFYQVFPDRFRNADPDNDPPREMRERPYGGDLQGVLDTLPYLDSLGVDAISLDPLFWARSLHEGDDNIFHHVDPHFGPDPEGDFERMAQEDPADPDTWVWTAADRLFLGLVQEAHNRDIRVVIDGVFPHTGREFFAENEDGSDLHPGPKEYIFHSTERWMRPVVDGHEHPGVDGWRLGRAEDVPIGFWQDWNAYVRELNPEAYTVAEIWAPAAEIAVEGGFSAATNYHAFAYPAKGYLIDNAIGPPAFAELLNERREAFPAPNQHALLNLIDSHETERLASMIVNRGRTPYREPERFDYGGGERASPRQDPDYDVSRPGPVDRQIQHLVALFQMTYVGAPMIYYGTEAGLWGAGAPDARKPMVWPDLDYAPAAGEVSFDHDLFQFYRELIHLRHEHAPLRRGRFEVLFASEEQNIFAFERKLEGASVVVVLSRSDAAHSMRIPVGEGGPYEMVFLTRDDSHRVQQDATALLLELPERAGMVLVREE